MEYQVQTIQNIGMQDIADILVTAWESGYEWYHSYSWGDDKGRIDQLFMKHGKVGLAMEAENQPDNGVEVIVVTMTPERMAKGIQMYLDAMWDRYNRNLRIQDFDADDSDACVQYAVFGKQVFG